MDDFDWRSFLNQWSMALLRSEKLGRGLPQEEIDALWLGYPGASEEQVAQAESRLGTVLPPSYRAFLKASNGWRRTGPFIDRLWSTAEIEWFVVRHRDWAEGPDDFAVPDEQYFVYGDEQSPIMFRLAYLKTALEISAEGDGAIYLLNPQVVSADGEWEAWFFADWLPGAIRYRSFVEMLQTQYRELIGSEEVQRK
jgi:hypothetical protein